MQNLTFMRYGLVDPLAPLRSEALRLARAGSRVEAVEIADKMAAMYQPGVLNALAVAEVFVAVEDFDRAFNGWIPPTATGATG